MDLSNAMKTRAVRAIEGVHAAYYDGPDAIQVLEKRLADRRAAAAKHVYALATFARETEPKPAKAVDLYLSLCTHAEDEYKKAHNVENLADALPTWKVFKSNILTGMRDFGMDPRKFRSEGAFRTAKAKLRGDAAPESGDDSTTVTLPPAGELVQAENVDELLATTIQADTLRTLVAQIVFELETLKRSKTKEAEAILRETMDKLAPLVDARKAA